MTSILSVKLTVEVLQGVTVLKSTILMKSYSKISLIKANLEKLEKKSSLISFYQNTSHKICTVKEAGAVQVGMAMWTGLDH